MISYTMGIIFLSYLLRRMFMLNTKVHLLSFSGTGNTKAVSDMIKKSFMRADWEVESLSAENYLKDPLKYDLSCGDLIGIGFPIYGLGEPLIIKQLVDQLPSASHKTTFLFLTAADFLSINHNATRKLKSALLAKGYSVVYERIIVMGSNWLVHYPESMTKQLYEVAKHKSNLLVTDVLNGQTKIMQTNILLRAIASLSITLERHFGARAFGLSLKNDQTCDQCLNCINMCPTNNISMKNGKLKFASNCIMCMRCVYGCDHKSLHSRGMNVFIHKKQYKLKNIINDDQLKTDYINAQTKGYYKHFNKYINDDDL